MSRERQDSESFPKKGNALFDDPTTTETMIRRKEVEFPN